MKLSANVGSDRSWVWNAAADVSEGEPEPQTLAIRFANSESTSCTAFSRLEAFFFEGEALLTRAIIYLDANLFKEAFIKAQQENEALFTKDAVE